TGMQVMSIKTIAAAALLSLGLAATSSAPTLAAGVTVAPPAQDWSWEGPFGRFDKAQLQRGFKVYKNVCSACHGMDLMAYRNLAQPGGPGFTEEQAEVIAAEYIVEDISTEDGQSFERPAELTDRFFQPFPNEAAARASNGGAYPPDLSVMAKARPNGPDYIRALLLGYTDPPAEELENAAAGKYYNTYYPGHWISMAPVLSDDLIEYTDGTPMTEEQYAEDVSAFMMWTAEPKLEERRSVGFIGMILLVVLASLLFATTRTIWAGVKH
ncbi:MAG: cytochrome c1, partial [Pseudomonadota bacterium]